jgi:hypothetical protein
MSTQPDQPIVINVTALADSLAQSLAYNENATEKLKKQVTENYRNGKSNTKPVAQDHISEQARKCLDEVAESLRNEGRLLDRLLERTKFLEPNDCEPYNDYKGISQVIAEALAEGDIAKVESLAAFCFLIAGILCGL